MSINATFPAGTTELVVHGLHQWDVGQTLTISASNLPGTCEVHFAYPGRSEAIVCDCHRVDGVIAVAIPDECLKQALPIVVWVYAVGATYGETTHVVILPIQARPKPSATITPRTPVLMDTIIEENGVRTAPDGVGFNKVTVAVPTKTKDVTIEANGTFSRSALTGSLDIYPDTVTVNVPTSGGGGSAGLYITGTYIMGGDTISLPLGPTEQSVLFTSNGISFAKIKMDPTDLWYVTTGGQEIHVYSEHDISTPEFGKWEHGDYKTLAFGAAYQPVESEFYSWLSLNASTISDGDVTLQTKTVTPTKESQVITPDSGYDGLSKVTVYAIPPSYVQPSGSKDISTNGTHDVSEYKTVTVNVPTSGEGSVTLIEKSVTPTNDTQVLLPSDQGADGYSKVTVNPIPTAPISPITANGSYSIADLTGSEDRYPDSITVNVPSSGGGTMPTCKIKFTENAKANIGGDSTLQGSVEGENYGGIVHMFESFYVYDRSTNTFSLKHIYSVEPGVEYEVLIGTVFDKGQYGSFKWSGGTVTERIYDSNTGECCIYRIDAVSSNIGATITFDVSW